RQRHRARDRDPGPAALRGRGPGRHLAHALERPAHSRRRERADPGTQSVLTSGRDGRRGRRALRPLRAGSLTSARRRLLPAAIRLFPACDPRCVTHRSRIINDTLISLDRLVVSGATLPGLASALIPPGRFPWETPNSHVGERE